MIDPDFDIELKLLLEGVYLKYQQDFRQYSVASMRRRMRAAVDRFDCKTLSQLQDRVLHEPAVFAQMLRYFTVQVSEMFRDPPYFKAIRELVIPELQTHPTFKIWVAGCSTGEEVWSLAILLDEEGLLERALIYATDINPEALRKAGEGIYDLDRISQFSSNYIAAGGKASLSDYFTIAYDKAIIPQRFKSQVVFSDHSLSTDSVFSEVHFVSCRNVLIYFNRELQNRAIGLFYDSLSHRGMLGLGNKESLQLTSFADRFKEIAREERLYQRT
ncbi:CheR family methyltransferase [Noviherbaspirillum galbum]|uniref:Protein-glutamate O-methyltransferase CheR n=1 Tax=Noviherbaspirillum galbum TaxID=2709383 RepID=A0A6B3STC7_9BURK|nr:CheR family methyltransferase [Noviherbaspirillum galbum]NEX62595.1 protein-glutamate O-methyltransferase CheR [Noviherbaspirillum galbum]